MPLWGGIEGGGTKFVCAIANDNGEILEDTSFPTTTPAETIGKAIAFFQKHHVIEPLKAVGISTFGPVDLNLTSPTYGYITTTPKPGWATTDFVGETQRAMNLPVGFDTDVNGAALAEYRWGAAQGLDTFVYLTIGTGIGGGGMVNGQLIHGMIHPEMGHMLMRRDPEKDPFEGWCPYHGDCLEGLAAGPALDARWGQRGETLPADHPAWELEAEYIAQGLTNIILVLSPQRLILGGGVMHQRSIFPLIRQKVQAYLNDYVKAPAIQKNIDTYIVPPGLGDRAGVLGAIALAQLAAETR